MLIYALSDPASFLKRCKWDEKKMSKRKFHAFDMETNILTMTQPDINVFSHIELTNSRKKWTHKHLHSQTRANTHRWNEKIFYAKILKWNDKRKTNAQLYTHIRCVVTKNLKEITLYSYRHETIKKRNEKEQQPKKILSTYKTGKFVNE